MKQMFSYNKFNDSAIDTLVESGVALAYAVIEGNNNTHEYEEANAKFNESFMKYCVEAVPSMAFSSVEDVKNPMLHKNACAKRS